MSASGLSSPTLARFERILQQRRELDTDESTTLAASMGDVLSARADAQADDEHDPEGPTLSFEWSRLDAVQREAAADLHAVDAALSRLADGTFGVCVRCGRPIGIDRLNARPTAELCIDCARSVGA
ncbi:TraR/DksA family transcriptional regulator [Diaminobutyricibacter sp. McL0618]|jgi:RNA polymerase-binding protein DksA|uniref:TraR/DksA family transcriptional regulator n=1 Tax=Leifsonia sp. McL0618 TaxID=3415677 RepID=UPI003CEAA5B3